MSNPWLGEQRRGAIIQMALQPLSALTLSDGLEAPPHRVLADDLLHAQQLGEHAVIP
jgi:hypothetical protein